MFRITRRAVAALLTGSAWAARGGGSAVAAAEGQTPETEEADLDVRMFGARGDAVTDDTIPIQRAIDAAIARQIASGGPRTVWLFGRHRITAPLRGFRYSGGSFGVSSFTLCGRARGYASSDRTEIMPTFNNAPAIILQKARNVLLDDFAIVGCANNGGVPTYEQLLNDDVSPWWNSRGAVDAPFSPQCGVAIDPFGRGVPGDGGYPGLNGRGGPNLYTDKLSGSSGVTLGEGMMITGNIVGVAISLSGSTQLGDNIKIGGNLSANKVCVAVGQSQDRGVWIERPFVLGCQVFVDCARYGTGTAEVPKVTRGIVDYVKWLIAAHSAGYGPGGTLDDLYCESIYSLGFYGGNGYPLKINGGEFKFLAGQAAATAAADCHFSNHAPVLVTGGSWTFYSNAARRLSIANQNKITFIGTAFDDIPAFGAPEMVDLKDCTLRYIGGNYGVTDRIADELWRVGASRHGASLTPGGEIVEGGLTSRRRWQETEGWRAYDLDRTEVTVTGPGRAQFTVSDSGRYQVGRYLQASTRWAVWPGGPSGLPVTGHNLVIGRVARIEGVTVTLEEVPQGLVTGTYQLGFCGLGQIRQRTIGTTRTGSDRITGVTPANAFAVGDIIRGAGIKEATYVTAVAGSTMSISTRATESGPVALYDQVLRCRGLAAAPPDSGVWFHGDHLEALAPTVDPNGRLVLGWTCIATGAPGTWVGIEA